MLPYTRSNLKSVLHSVNVLFQFPELLGSISYNAPHPPTFYNKILLTDQLMHLSRFKVGQWVDMINL